MSTVGSVVSILVDALATIVERMIDESPTTSHAEARALLLRELTHRLDRWPHEGPPPTLRDGAALVDALADEAEGRKFR